jgi:hypothetical protein
MTVLLAALALGLLVVAPWTVVSGNAEVGDPSVPLAGLSLEGIWTTMIPTASGHASINSMVVQAQGTEGLVYTVVCKHPQCSHTLLGYFPESERLSDMLGYCVRTGAETFELSMIWHGVKEGGPERMGIGEIIFMGVISGTLEFTGADTLQFSGTISAYTPDQDADGDRLPDDGAVPMACVPVGFTFKRLPMPPSCEPTPLPPGLE